MKDLPHQRALGCFDRNLPSKAPRCFAPLLGVPGYISVAWVAVTVAGGVKCHAQEGVVTPTAKGFPVGFYSCFNGYTNIAHFRVGISGSSYFVNKRQGTGWVYYEGAFQPNTCFVRCLTNDLEEFMKHVGPLRPGSVVGESYTMYWSVDRISGGSIGVSSRVKPNSPTAHDFPRDTLKAVGGLLANVFRLGLIDVDLETLRWTSADEFRASGTSSAGRKFTLAGRVAERDGDRPVSLECTLSKLPIKRLRVAYTYVNDGNRPPDVPMLIDVSVEGQSAFRYRIDELKFGAADQPEGGFSFEAHTNFPNLYRVFYTNDATYALHGGTLRLVAPPSKTRPLNRSMVGIFFVLVNLPFLAWLLARRRRGRLHAGAQ